MKFVFFLLVAVAGVLAAVQEPRQLIFNREAFPKQWKLVGFASADDEVEFTIGLRQRNLDKLEQIFWAVSDPTSSDYQNFLTYKEIMDLIAPPAHESEYVQSYFSQGALGVTDRGDNLLVRAPVKVVEKLFDTKLYVFKHAKQSVEIIRQLGPYSLPVSVAEYVGIVSSLSDFPMIDVRPKVTFGNQGIVPQVLEAQYNIPSDASASGTSQGVIEFGAGQYFSPSSLATFSKKVDIPITPLTQSHIIAPAPPVGVEGTLDIQYISTTGKGSTNWYWTDKTWLYDWSAKFSSASDKPEIVSISYGWSELAQCEIAGDECQVLGVDSEQYVARVNTEFQKIGVQGVSLLCASGDSGANGRTDPDCTADKLRPAFPAASPYITAVGATQLVNPSTPLSKDPPICTDGGFSCKSGGQETAVSFNEASFASGGGFSNFAPQPSYQTAAVAAYLNSTVKMPPASYFNASNRGFPDVASLGHAILIYSSSMGGVAAVGGTSASSPSFAGYMSLLNQVSKEKTNGKSLGFLNPLLYKMAADQPDTFTDITVGDNICTESGCGASCKGFKCATGWDPVTGLGVANVANMIKYVKSM